MSQQKHNYEKKWHELSVKWAALRPEAATRIAIWHDPWCASSEGGFCNCDLNFTVMNLNAEHKVEVFEHVTGKSKDN
jgi:hypothetical protein